MLQQILVYLWVESATPVNYQISDVIVLRSGLCDPSLNSVTCVVRLITLGSRPACYFPLLLVSLLLFFHMKIARKYVRYWH